MDTINASDLVDSKITSRYTIVLAAAKRARQIINGAHPLTYAPTDRAVSIAVKEMSEGKLAIKIQDDLIEGTYERMLKDQYRYRNITALSKDDLREDLKENYEPDTYLLEDDDDDEVIYRDHYDNELGEEKDDYGLYNDDFDD